MRTKVDVSVKKLCTDNASLDCISFGNGPRNLVVLPGVSLHALTPSAAAVAAKFSAFCDDFTIYLLDHEDELAKGATLRDVASHMEDAVAQLGINSCCIYGVSMGGMVAQLVAADNPQLVEALVLCSTSARLSSGLEEVIRQWVALAQEGDPSPLNRSFFAHIYSSEYFEKNAKAFALLENMGTPEEMYRLIGQAEAALTLNNREVAASITCPTMVVVPGADKVIEPEEGLFLAQTISGSTLEYFEGAPHAVYDENPAVLAKVRAFLLKEV